MKPICSKVSYYRGKKYLSELFDSTDFSKFKPVTQVKGVCFFGGDIILSVKKDGGLIFPGGGIEDGESYEDALRRELVEEASLSLVDYGSSCYLKITKFSDPREVSYFTRYWVEVELLDKPILDPDGKSVDRLVVPVQDFYKHIQDENRRKIFDISLKLYKKSKESK